MLDSHKEATRFTPYQIMIILSFEGMIEYYPLLGGIVMGLMIATIGFMYTINNIIKKTSCIRVTDSKFHKVSYCRILN